jgi:hypothetical protein
MVEPVPAVVVDLARVRRARAELDRLAVEHPELVDLAARGAGNLARWIAALEGLDGEPMETNDAQMALRLPSGLVERIDRELDRLRTVYPAGVVLTRADVVRMLLIQALDRLEARPETVDNGKR